MFVVGCNQFLGVRRIALFRCDLVDLKSCIFTDISAEILGDGSCDSANPIHAVLDEPRNNLFILVPLGPGSYCGGIVPGPCANVIRMQLRSREGAGILQNTAVPLANTNLLFPPSCGLLFSPSWDTSRRFSLVLGPNDGLKLVTFSICGRVLSVVFASCTNRSEVQMFTCDNSLSVSNATMASPSTNATLAALSSWAMPVPAVPEYFAVAIACPQSMELFFCACLFDLSKCNCTAPSETEPVTSTPNTGYPSLSFDEVGQAIVVFLGSGSNYLVAIRCWLSAFGADFSKSPAGPRCFSGRLANFNVALEWVTSDTSEGIVAVGLTVASGKTLSIALFGTFWQGLDLNATAIIDASEGVSLGQFSGVKPSLVLDRTSGTALVTTDGFSTYSIQCSDDGCIVACPSAAANSSLIVSAKSTLVTSDSAGQSVLLVTAGVPIVASLITRQAQGTRSLCATDSIRVAMIGAEFNSSIAQTNTTFVRMRVRGIMHAWFGDALALVQ